MIGNIRRLAGIVGLAVALGGTGCSGTQTADPREKRIQACMAELNRQARDEGYPAGNARAACEKSIPPS